MFRVSGIGSEKLKILQYIEQDNRVLVSVLYPDGTFSTLNMLNTHNRDEILKDVYIITSDSRNRQPFEGEIPANLEQYHKPQSSPSFLRNVDFFNLSADIYDQFGDKMNVDVTFEIEGTSARIENGKIVEDEVTEDTPYFIVAKYGGLEERQERTIYAPREIEPSEIDMLNKKIELLASENEAKDDLLQEIILQMYQ